LRAVFRSDWFSGGDWFNWFGDYGRDGVCNGYVHIVRDRWWGCDGGNGFHCDVIDEKIFRTSPFAFHANDNFNTAVFRHNRFGNMAIPLAISHSMSMYPMPFAIQPHARFCTIRIRLSIQMCLYGGGHCDAAARL